ncbi:hypothetical protein MXMO3_03693 (plasmid) [Maritalea myrionectae]|uniref:Uncharacterized protein n=1 Tax=Maritalea myrionectae TaxID=454601 RepID=A0A2R4MJU8_9HYPH|nr:alpha/beta hydrolase [Maritalea myrionectae]AVX06196.1 hypothetical protein MXMO3_03693 [Maritalea myrionectae]
MAKIDIVNDKMEVLGGLMSISALSGSERKKAVDDIIAEDVQLLDATMSGLQLGPDLVFQRVLIGELNSTDAFISDYEIADAFHSRFGEHITLAELDVLKSLLSGETLKEASQRDGRSYQTKRNQFSALRGKSHLNQPALIQTMTVLLLNVVHHRLKHNGPNARWLHDYLRKYYGDHSRLHHLHLSSGRTLLVADIGPIQGQPALCMHTLSFPIIPIPSKQSVLRTHNIRLLLPIRPNHYGAPNYAKDINSSLKYFAQDCAEMVCTFSLGQLPILSHGSGFSAALAVATELKKSCSRLIMYSATIEVPAANAQRDMFGASWSMLRMRYGKLLAPVLLTAMKYFLNRGVRDRAVLRQYENSPLDHDVVQRFLEADWFQDALSYAVEHNYQGILEDCNHSETNLLNLIKNCRVPIRFIFGEEDRHSCSSALPGWLNKHQLDQNVELDFIKNHGQATLMESPEILFELLF